MCSVHTGEQEGQGAMLLCSCLGKVLSQA